jgi:hypothetical protein
VSRGSFTFTWNGEAVAQDVKAAMAAALIAGSVELTAQMKDNIDGPSPSKPGAFPGLDTGALTSSVNFTPDLAALKSKVGTHYKYGRWLEYGTSKMLPRPWVLRSYEKAKHIIRRKMMEEAERALAKRAAARANTGGRAA